MHFVNLCMKFFDKLAYMYIACTALDNAISFITKEMPENKVKICDYTSKNFLSDVFQYCNCYGLKILYLKFFNHICIIFFQCLKTRKYAISPFKRDSIP